MDSKGSATIEIAIVIVIIVLIISVLASITYETNEKITNSILNENYEKLLAESLDNLINNPGAPPHWEKLDNPYNITPGLAIEDENNQTIPNSVSYKKFLKLNEFYNNLIDNKLFQNKVKTSLTLEPIESTVSSVTVGDKFVSSPDTYTVERLVICDFYSEYVVKDFNNNTKCNHNHKDDSCDYFKLYPSWLESYDYYLLIKEPSKNLKYSIDTTESENNNYETVDSDKICLNEILKEKCSESGSIFFIHFNDKNMKVVLIQIPKNFDKDCLKYDYFTKTQCNLILKSSD